MAETTQVLTADVKLFTRTWQTTEPRAVIALIHGFGEHSGRYAHVADFFNKNGFAVVAMDVRGHGLSEGKRGHTPRFETYLDDLAMFIDFVKTQFVGKPLFLYGHSMGGNLVLNYVLNRKTDGIAGVVATSPWTRLAFEPKPILITLGKMMRSIYPAFSQDSALNADHISTDPSVVAAYKADPLVHSKITASAGMGIKDAGEWLADFKGKMPIPTLIMHAGDDRLTSQPASEAFAKQVSGDVTYRKWNGMFHEIHNEPDKLAVFNYTLGWLDSKI